MTSRTHHPRSHRSAAATHSRHSAAPPKLDVAPLLDTVTELAVAVVGGRVAYINRPGLALLAYSRDDGVTGGPLDRILDPRTLHDLLVRRQDAAASDRGEWVRAPLRRADGSSVEAELRLATIAGTDTLMVVARRAEPQSAFGGDEAAAARHAAEGLKNLIANMAHELRTPLNAIIGFSEIIAQRMFGELNDRYVAYAGDIMESGHHLLRIINDILDYAKVEAGEMTLRVEKASVNDIVRSSLRLVAAQAEEAGLEIVDQLAEIAKPLHLDSTKVRQIVVNLLSNAIKFTPRGGQVRVGSKLVAPDKVEIWVADSGIGMTEAEVREAILPFRQPRRPPDGSYIGTGLGLPIAKALVGLHGGELSISSKRKVGTNVRFTLQDRPPDAPNGLFLDR